MERNNPNPIAPAQPQDAQSSGGWRDVGVALLFLSVYFLVQLAVGIPYVCIVIVRAALTHGPAVLEAIQAELASAAQSELLTGIADAAALGAFVLTLRCLHRPVLASLGVRRVRIGALLPLVPLGVALNVLLTSLISLLPTQVLAPYMEASAPVLVGRYGVLSVLIMTVLAPLTEEALFRGLVYGNLRRALPRWLAVALSSIVFGLLHGQLLWMLYTAALGAFFCVVRDRRDSLVSCILLHMAFNAGSYLVLMMQNTPVGVALPIAGAVAAACSWLFFGRSSREAAV